jgi:diguanylate cyclase (GGDEF)-like protein
MSEPLQVLFEGRGAPAPDLTSSSFGPFIVHTCSGLDEAARSLQLARHDALLLRAATPPDLHALQAWGALPHIVLDTAVVVLTPEPAANDLARLIQFGVQEVVPLRDAHSERLGLALRQAVQRKRIEVAGRRAFATDLGTGLPNRAQLMEHMTHLLALREREPAPMALIELRVEGIAHAAATLGVEAANVLRRKVAVRLRSALRASDVLAALGDDRFVVLLAWLDDAADGERVAIKLAQSLQRPLSVAGRDLTFAVGVGIARYPADARDADALLRLTASQAVQSRARGRAGLLHGVQRTAAANDESPSQL